MPQPEKQAFRACALALNSRVFLLDGPFTNAEVKSGIL